MVILRQTDIWSDSLYSSLTFSKTMKPLMAHFQDRPPHCPVFSVCLSWIFFLQGPGPRRGFLLLDGEVHFPRGASFDPGPGKIRQMARESENLSRIFAIASAFHWVTSAIQLRGKWQKSKTTLSHTLSALSRLLVPLKSPSHGQRHMSLCTGEMALIHVSGLYMYACIWTCIQKDWTH